MSHDCNLLPPPPPPLPLPSFQLNTKNIDYAPMTHVIELYYRYGWCSYDTCHWIILYQKVRPYLNLQYWKLFYDIICHKPQKIRFLLHKGQNKVNFDIKRIYPDKAYVKNILVVYMNQKIEIAVWFRSPWRYPR